MDIKTFSDWKATQTLRKERLVKKNGQIYLWKYSLK